MPRFWNWLRNALRAGRTSTRPPARPGKSPARLEVERLEARELLSVNLNWLNRGQASDGFAAVYPNTATANLARSVIDTARNEWSSVVNDLNRQDPKYTNTVLRNQINLTIAISTDNSAGGASATVTNTDANGIPTAATITINHFATSQLDPTGTVTIRTGWYLNPTLWSSAFLGTPTNAYAGYPQTGSPAAGQADLLEVVTHELGHALGFYSGAQVNARCTDTGIADNTSGGGKGNYCAFKGPTGFTALLTSFDSGPTPDKKGGEHFAAAGATYTDPKTGIVYSGIDDLMTPYYSSGQRRIVSESDADVLRDAYGYSVNDPAQVLGTFYAVLDETGTLTVRGRQDAPSNDTISLSTANGNTVITAVTLGTPVPGLPLVSGVFQFPAGPINRIDIQTGAGTSYVNLNAAFTAPITVTNGGPAYVYVGSGDLARVEAPINILNSSAFRTNIVVNDIGGTVNQTWTFQISNGPVGKVPSGRINRSSGPSITYRLGDAGVISLGTGRVTEYVNVSAVQATSLILSGDSYDTFVNLGTGNLANISAPVVVDSLYRTTLSVDDSGDTADQGVLIDNSPSRSGYGRIIGLGPTIDFQYNGVNLAPGVTIRTGSGSASVLVSAAAVPLTLIGNSSDTTFTVGGAGGLNSISAYVFANATLGHSARLVVDDRGGTTTSFQRSYGIEDHAVSSYSTNTQVGFGNNILRVVLQTANQATILPTTVEVTGVLPGVALEVDASTAATSVNAYFESAGGHQLLGTVTVVGNAQTSVSALDFLATPQIYTLRAGSVSETGRGTVSYRGVGTVGVAGGNGHNQFNIQGTAAGVVTTVSGGTGSDEFVVQGENNTMDAIQGALTIHGRLAGSEPGYERISLYDYYNPAAQTFDFTATTAQRSGLALITFDRLYQVALYASAFAPAAINVYSAAAGTNLILGVANGDVVTIGDGTLDAMLGYVNVNALTGTTQTVVINDSADQAAHDTTTSADGSGVYLNGLTPGGLLFGLDPASTVQVQTGTGAVTGLDAFFALLAAQPRR